MIPEEPEIRYIALAFFFFASIAFSVLINSILLRFVKTLGTKNQPGTDVRWSAITKPAIGGLSFFFSFLFSLLFYFLFFQANMPANPVIMGGLVGASTLGFLMGLADDAYNTKPLLKLLVQALCGLVLFFSGSAIELTGYVELNMLITVLWTVGIMNSINMLDNMDAIASVVSASIFSVILVCLALRGQLASADFLLILGATATLVGFLFYNWNPSKMYMGDTGSQFLGVLLAYVGIHYGWDIPAKSSYLHWGWLRPVLIIWLLFVLPITDTLTVSINRMLQKRSPFVGGRDHTTHSLSYAGLSDSQVAFVFIGISLISMGFIIYLTVYVPTWGWRQGLPALAFVLGTGIVLFIISRKNKLQNFE